MQSRSLLDEALEDFPKSEIWRIQTDGCQAKKGPANFRTEFYEGMNAGFEYLRQHGHAIVTPLLIEEIYHSVYFFEENYTKDPLLKKGFNTSPGGFEIFLPEPGHENEAGITEVGLDELIPILRKSEQEKGAHSFAYLSLSIQRYNKIALYPDPSQENFKTDVLSYLKTASHGKKKYKGNQIQSAEQLVKVILSTHARKRDEIIQYVQNDIDIYYRELNFCTSFDNEIQKKIEVRKTINRFIRKMHQTHYFPDGNGRTCIFILQNMLLLQNGFELKITETPAHFAAYSSEELLIETEADLGRFQAYKITQAKNFLADLNKNDIEPKTLKKQICSCLNSDPLIAMAQINELFSKIKSEELIVPKDYNSSLPIGLINFFKPNDPEVTTARQNLMALLKEMYLENLHLVAINEASLEPCKQLGCGEIEPQKVLFDILNRQELSKTFEPGIISSAAYDAFPKHSSYQSSY